MPMTVEQPADEALEPEMVRNMAEDDVLELRSILPGLSDEPMRLRVMKRIKPDVYDQEFLVTYIGITIGRWGVKIKGKELDWSYKVA